MKRILTLATILFLTAVPALAKGGHGTGGPFGKQAAVDAGRQSSANLRGAASRPNVKPANAAKLDAAADRIDGVVAHALAGCSTCH